MIVVSDTSAITALLQVKREALLKELYGEVLIPETVQEELETVADFRLSDEVKAVAFRKAGEL